MILRNDLISYVTELKSSGQFNSALAKLIIFSTGAAHGPTESGNYSMIFTSGIDLSIKTMNLPLSIIIDVLTFDLINMFFS